MAYSRCKFIQLLNHFICRNVLPRHCSDSQSSLLLFIIVHIHHHLLIRVQAEDLGEVICSFRGEITFRMRCADYRQIATEGFFNLLVKMISVRLA